MKQDMNKGFNYGSICRDDVLHTINYIEHEDKEKYERKKKTIENLSDVEMDQLADMMWGSCCDNLFDSLRDAFEYIDEEEGV